MKGIRFTNVIAVYNWSYKPINISDFFLIFFVKLVSYKRFYWYIKLLLSKIDFKQRNNHEVSCDSNFCMEFLTTSNSKSVIETLRIVTIEVVNIHSYIIITWVA